MYVYALRTILNWSFCDIFRDTDKSGKKMQSSHKKEQEGKVYATPRTEPLKPVRVVLYICYCIKRHNLFQSFVLPVLP